jgi:hypothetical protein
VKLFAHAIRSAVKNPSLSRYAACGSPSTS